MPRCLLQRSRVVPFASKALHAPRLVLEQARARVRRVVLQDARAINSRASEGLRECAKTSSHTTASNARLIQIQSLYAIDRSFKSRVSPFRPEALSLGQDDALTSDTRPRCPPRSPRALPRSSGARTHLCARPRTRQRPRRVVSRRFEPMFVVRGKAKNRFA